MGPRTRRHAAVAAAAALLLLLLALVITDHSPPGPAPGPVRTPQDGSRGETAPAPAPPASAEVDETAARIPDAPPPPDEKPTGAVEGRLRFDDGTPVANQPVWLWGVTRPVARTDASGRYRLEGQSTSALGHEVMVGPPDASVRVGPVTLAPGETVRFDAVIPQGTDLVLEIVDGANARPLAGVWVALDGIPRMTDHVFAAGTTDEHGRILFSHVALRLWRIRIRHDGYRPFREEVDLESAPPVGPHRVVLERAETLTLRVEPAPAEKDTPVNMHLLDLSRGTGYPYVGNLDEAGIFQGDAPPPGTYHVILGLGGLGQIALPDVVVEARQSVEITATLPSGGGVSGLILSPDARPIAGATIELWQDAPPKSGPRAGLRVQLRAEPTGEDGVFRINLVPAGRYAVSVHLERQTLYGITDPIEVDERGRQGLRLRLPRGGSIHGRIEGPPDPRRNHVQLLRRDGERWVDGALVRIDADGTFTARHLSAGRWRVGGMPAGRDQATAVEVDVHEGGPPVEVTLRFRGPPRTVVLISTAAGPPFSGRLNAIAFALGESPSLRVVPLTVDEDGRAEILGLAAGRYQITIRRPGQTTGGTQVEIEVREGVIEPIRIRLDD